MALGAGSPAVASVVMRHVLLLATTGWIAGLAGVVALTRIIKSGLYGVHRRTRAEARDYISI
jgi:hypothetical protein